MKKIDLTNKRFERLLVLESTDKRSGTSVVWKCLCDCGNIVYISSNDLIRGRIKSCKCYRNDMFSKYRQKGQESNKLGFGISAKNAIYRSYKQNAKNRSLDFELTKENFEYLIQQPCCYCGSKPNQVSKPTHSNGSYIYNGIDRIDNSKGYVLDNVVPCCKVCNRAKQQMTVEEFLNWISKVYKNKELDLLYDTKTT